MHLSCVHQHVQEFSAEYWGQHALTAGGPGRAWLRERTGGWRGCPSSRVGSKFLRNGRRCMSTHALHNLLHLMNGWLVLASVRIPFPTTEASRHGLTSINFQAPNKCQKRTITYQACNCYMLGRHISYQNVFGASECTSELQAGQGCERGQGHEALGGDLSAVSKAQGCQPAQL